MFNAYGEVLLADFGLSRVSGAGVADRRAASVVCGLCVASSVRSCEYFTAVRVSVDGSSYRDAGPGLWCTLYVRPAVRECNVP